MTPSEIRQAMATARVRTQEACEREDWHATERGARELQDLANRLWHAEHAEKKPQTGARRISVKG